MQFMLRYSQVIKIYWDVNDLSKTINMKSLCNILISYLNLEILDNNVNNIP